MDLSRDNNDNNERNNGVGPWTRFSKVDKKERHATTPRPREHNRAVGNEPQQLPYLYIYVHYGLRMLPQSLALAVCSPSLATPVKTNTMVSLPHPCLA